MYYLFIVYNWWMWNIGKFIIYLVFYFILIFKYICDYYIKFLKYESNYLKLNYIIIFWVVYVEIINKRIYSN